MPCNNCSLYLLYHDLAQDSQLLQRTLHLAIFAFVAYSCLCFPAIFWAAEECMPKQYWHAEAHLGLTVARACSDMPCECA